MSMLRSSSSGGRASYGPASRAGAFTPAAADLPQVLRARDPVPPEPARRTEALEQARRYAG
ncbi:hypothetical protein [Streptomyces sp. NPDC053367]|uniref:hypothetical protein n=1 Tax=Streptomyces sp. NPDC053367 TaxID=3365700 RepID=UPI0037D702F0